MLTRYERLVAQYKTWYPKFYEQTVDCIPIGMNTLSVHLRDGDILEFSGFDNTIRNVTKYYKDTYIDNVDEKGWREEFGRRLRKMIIDRGIRQERLAETVGISPQMMTRYVRGLSMPSAYNISRLARALRCDPRELTLFGYLDNEEET